MENSPIVIQLDLAMKSKEATILIRNQQCRVHYTSNYYKHAIYYNALLWRRLVPLQENQVHVNLHSANNIRLNHSMLCRGRDNICIRCFYIHVNVHCICQQPMTVERHISGQISYYLFIYLFSNKIFKYCLKDLF